MRYPAASDVALAVLMGITLGCAGPVELAGGVHGDDQAEKPIFTRPFGSFSYSIAPRVDAFGGIDGLRPGMGFALWMPPLLPVQTVGAYAVGAGVGIIFASPLLLFEAALGGNDGVGIQIAGEIAEEVTAAILRDLTFHSGLEDVLGPYSFGVLSDLSLELGFTGSYHVDELEGGRARHHGVLLGVRLAGAKKRVPRLYLAGGGGWHWLDFDNRAAASVPGLYGSAGAEFFSASGSASIGFEIRGHLLIGSDKDGVPMDGGFTALSVTACYYWW